VCVNEYVRVCGEQEIHGDAECQQLNRARTAVVRDSKQLGQKDEGCIPTCKCSRPTDFCKYLDSSCAKLTLTCGKLGATRGSAPGGWSEGPTTKPIIPHQQLLDLPRKQRHDDVTG